MTLAFVTVETKLLGKELDIDSFTLSSLQRYAGEALQLNRTDLLVITRGGEVDLRNLISSHFASILHLKRETDALVGC